MVTLSAIKRRTLTLPAILILLAAACDDSPTAPQLGYVTAHVAVTGGDLDDSFFVNADSIVARVNANERVTFQVAEGTHSVQLSGIATNCVLNGNPAVSVAVVEDDTVQVVFNVDCAETGIRVETRTTGVELPTAPFTVVLTPGTQSAIGVNGSVSITRLTPGGNHDVKLRVGIGNCGVAGDTIVRVAVVNRQLTNVIFNVQCAPVLRNGVVAFLEGSGIHVMSPDGSNKQLLVNGYAPAWSRDGGRIIYSTTDCYYYSPCTGGLSVIDVTSRQVVPLQHAAAGIEPAWSPTDDVIAYVDGWSGSLHMLNLSAPPAVQIQLPSVTRVHNPSWSPDGTKLVAVCEQSAGVARLCIFNRDGSGLRYLDVVVTFGSSPSWSPDGNRIAFFGISGGQAALNIVNPDGSGAQYLTGGTAPSWSPDSKQIMFSGSQGLFVINADGSILRRVTSGFHYSPEWRR